MADVRAHATNTFALQSVPAALQELAGVKFNRCWACWPAHVVSGGNSRPAWGWGGGRVLAGGAAA